MDKLEEIEKLAKECLHCNRIPKAYQNYNGDEYMFECECGICTGWHDEKKLLQVWNARPFIK